MDTILENFCSDKQFVKEIFTHITKYAMGEIIITDENFNILFQNSKFEFHSSKFDIYALNPKCNNINIGINLERFKKSPQTHLYMKLVFDSENHFQDIPMDVHICKIKDNENKTKGYSIFIQDITQEVKNRIQKETFIDIITHDLKNPIRANIRILDLILKNKFGDIDGDLKDILNELHMSCNFISYMADNLLIKYKNEFNRYDIEKEEYSIINIIKEKYDKLMKIFNRKNQIVELDIKGKIPNLLFDIEEIGKVVTNLLINASEQSIKNSKIKIEIEKDKKFVNVSFYDYGYPEKEATLNSLFEEYISNSNKLRKIGFSLELFNCKKVVEAHNGTIIARNNNNIGNIITFSLPV